MTSTYSSSLRLELMATGDQSGTWGDTTNTNLGTLLEQAITGYLSVAQGDVANLTLTTVNGGSDQARNAVVNVTGALTANRNVVVQTANKLYLVKNATTGGYSIVVKTAAGTGVTIVNGASRWVYSDGTNVVDGQFGPLLPSSNDGGALGAVGTAWSDLYGATGFTFNLNNDWIATHSAAVLTVGTGDLRVTTAGTNTASVVTVGGTQTLTNKTMTSPVLNTPTVGTSLLPTTDDGAPLGSTSKEWSDLFLATGGVINWAAGDVTITHSANLLAFAGASSGYTFDVPIGVASGGTGSSSLTANNVLLGNGTSALQVVAPGTSGNVLTSNGTTWASSAPVIGGMTLLGTLTTTSGTTQSLTGIAAGYLQFYIEVDGVSFASGSSQLTLALSSTNGAAYGTAQNVAPALGTAASTYQGPIVLYGGGTTSQFTVAMSYVSTGAPPTAGATPTQTYIAIGTNTAAVVNAMRFAGGTFDAGAIRIYGVK